MMQDETMSLASAWVDLEIIILMNKIGQRKKNITWYHLYVDFKKIIQMNIFTNRLTDKKANLQLVTKGEGKKR